jgi:hypothetical protein
LIVVPQELVVLYFKISQNDYFEENVKKGKELKIEDEKSNESELNTSNPNLLKNIVKLEDFIPRREKEYVPLLFTNHNLMNKKTRDITKSPFLDFLFREFVLQSGLTPLQDAKNNEELRIKNDIYQIEKREIKNYVETDYEILDENGLGIVLFWKSVGGTQIGQFHIPKINFLPSLKHNVDVNESMSVMGKKYMQSPLTIALHYEKTIKLNDEK